MPYQEGQTATGPNGEKIVFRGGGWQAVGAAADPVIAVDPYKQAEQQRQVAAAARAEEELRMKRSKEARDAVIDQRKIDAGPQGDATEGERNNAAYYKRAAEALQAYEDANAGPRTYAGAAIQAIPGGDAILRGLPDSIGDDTSRRQSDQAIVNFSTQILRSDSGANTPEPEVTRYQGIYFPRPGETDPNLLEQYRQARLTALAALREKAGRMSPKEANIRPGNDGQAQDGGNGENLPGAQPGDLQVTVTDDSPSPPPNPEAARLQQEYQQRFGDNPAGADGLFTLAKQGITGGLSDEASGVGGAIAGVLRGDFNVGQNYRNARDAEMLNIEAARKFHPTAGLPAELLGALASGGAGTGNALTMGQGALAAGVGGFGYGRGWENSAGNALLSAAGGAALVRGGNALGNALAGRAAASSDMGARVAGLARAGEAEGVTVNRAMADPSLANRVTRADASVVGGRKVQGEMSRIEGQIEGRVKDLGRGGQAMDNIATGDKVKAAGERFIERSGKAAKVKYDRAEQLAGDAKIAPKESLRRVDEMIGQLSETPGTNKKEIAFLEEIKGDLGKDLSVGGLRRMRTKLRKQISKGELTFGEDEARVLAIMDGAADDIRAGLTAQGKAKAARAFDVADKAYRARMDYINGTVQKLIGKRGANLSAEQIAGKFSSMASNDARGLRKFYATLEPDEASDVAATFAERIGKNNKGDFSVAHFLAQTEKMSDDALKTLFGNEGAQSVRNLRQLGREVNRVTGAMNSRTSKTGVANYRDWLFNAVLGGGMGGVGGAASGGTVGTGALVGAAAVGSAKALKDALSARSVMSPNPSRWIRQAPTTTNPKAIDAHFSRLSEIAKAEPAIANEIDRLRDAIMRAANDNPAVSRSAAQDEDSRKR